MSIPPRLNPYVGPRAFLQGEQLFGREQEILQLTDTLIAQRIVMLHSPSGAGKTSLICAGLIPRLMDEGLQVLPVIRVDLEPPPDFASRQNFNRYVFSALLSLEGDLPEGQQHPNDKLADLSFQEYLEMRQSPDSDLQGRVLIFDQFEEILTTDPFDRQGKQDFFARLGEALQDRSIWALFSIREDFLGALEPYARHIPARLKETYRLDLLSRAAALRAVQMPAKSIGISFDDAAAMKLVEDLSRVQVQRPDGMFEQQVGSYIEPVQLQVVCFRLFERLAQEKSVIDEQEVSMVGDVDQSLARYYQTVVAQAAEKGVREVEIRTWFDRQLITPGGTRGLVMRGEEHSAGLDNRAVSLLLNSHLVRAERRAGIIWYELAHDRLIQPIRQDNTAWFQAHLSLLQRQTILWEEQGRPDHLLLRGNALENAQQWAANNPQELLPQNEEFLQASLKLRQVEQQVLDYQNQANQLAIEKRGAARLRRLTVTMAVALLAALILATIAGYFYNSADKQSRANATLAVENAENAAAAQVSRSTAVAGQVTAEALVTKVFSSEQQALRQAQIARAGELSALALSQSGRQFSLALLLGLEAIRTEDSDQTRQALYTILRENKPLNNFLWGHRGSVSGLAWSPDGRLASSSWDRTVIVWDLQRGRPAQILRGHDDAVWSVAWSADDRLASGSEDRTVIIWDLKSGVPAQTLRGHDSGVTELAWLADGRLASVSVDRTVIVWDLESGQPAQILQWSIQAVTSAAWSSDGRLAFGSVDGTVTIWDLKSSQSTQIMQGQGDSVSSLAWSPDGRLSSGSGSYTDYSVIIWDLKSGQPAQILQGHGGSVRSLAWSPDGRLASGSEDRKVIIWDLESGQPARTLQGHSQAVTELAWSADGRLASGSLDNRVIVWDLERVQPDQTLKGHTDSVWSVDWSEDGQLASGSNDRTVVIWSLQSDQPTARTLKYHSIITSVAWSLDGRLASGSTYKNVIIWDLESSQPAQTLQKHTSLQGHTSIVRSVAWSRDGRLASGSDDKSVIVWNLENAQPSQILQGHSDAVWFVSWSADGRLASGSRDGTVIIWDLERSLPAQVLRGHSNIVTELAWSADGRLASASGDGTVIIWDLERSLPAQILRGHSSWVRSVAWSADGRLASGAEDKTVIVWNLDSGQPAQTLQGHEASVASVAWSADGRLASGSEDRTVIVWQMDPETWIEQACQIAGRNFTIAEWRQYFPSEVYRPTCPQFPLETPVPAGTSIPPP